MSSTTVRISKTTHGILKRCSEQTGEPLQSILDRAVEAYRRRLFLERANAAFAALRENTDVWQAEQTERTEWEATLEDGLK